MIKVYKDVLGIELVDALRKMHENKSGFVDEYDPRDGYAFKDKVILNDSPIWEKVSTALFPYLEKYLSSCEYMNSLFFDALLMEKGIVYKVPEFSTALHFDSVVASNRVRYLIMLVYLNTPIGGELIFPGQKEVIPAETGTLTIFPSFFLYPHLVNPCVGDRYMLRVDVVDKNHKVLPI